MRTCAAALMATLFCVAALASEEKPNFTGVWKLGEGSSTLVDNIEHQYPELKIAFKSQYTAGSILGGLSGTESYTTDGVERTTKASNGRESWTTVNWQGPSLVILRVVKEGYHVTVTRETWTLSQDGGTLTKNRRTINMDGVTENTQVFQKQ
jgi:hypothetical protein